MDIELFRRSLRNDQNRMSDLRSVAADDGVVDGKFLVNNTGEAINTIIFPVKFSTIPTVTFGFELVDSTNIIPGHIPTMTAQVAKWNVIDRPPVSRVYIGADVRVVSTGPSGSKFVVTWTARGITFTNPV